MKKFINQIEDVSDVRREIFDICHDSKNGHIASSFSIVEMMYCLYDFYGGDEKKFDFILSKGHGAPCLYSILHKFNKINNAEFRSFCKYRSKLTSHVSSLVPGVAVSSGALGLGLSVGIGFCLANKIEKKEKKVYVLMGDGEMNEGSVWESLLYAGSSKLENIICLVDNNRLQASNYTNKIINTNLIFAAMKSMNWKIFYADGHDFSEIRNVYKKISHMKGPIAVIFDTIKGKGVSFMENNPLWHHKIPDKDEYIRGKKELSL